MRVAYSTTWIHRSTPKAAASFTALSWPVRDSTTDLSPRSVRSSCPEYGSDSASSRVMTAFESSEYN